VNWGDPGQVVDFVQQTYNRRDTYRGQREKQWYLNVGQYLGYQYHTFDGRTGSLSLPSAPPYRVRLVCNRLQGVSRKVVSKALRSRPVWTVVPATGERDDVNSARIAQKLLQYYWRYLNMDRVMVDLFTWVSTTGNGFLRVYWDPDKGEELDISQEVNQFLPDLKWKPGQTVRLGDVIVESVSPFELFVDPEASNMEDARYVIHTKIRDIAYLEDKYGLKGISPDASGSSSISRYYERRIQTMVSGTGGFEAKDETEENHSAFVHTLWMNPTKRFPQGQYAVVASNKILYQGPLPNPFKRIPYVHVREIAVPGQFYGTCSLETCIPMQTEYNRGRSQLCEIRNLMSKPKWFVIKGSGVPDTSLTSEPGEVVPHLLGMRPEAWTPPPVPDYVMRLLEYALKDLEDASAIHEVTQARAPSGVRSGVAIAQLQEQDDQMLAPAFMMAEKALSEIASWLLQLCAENIKEPRIIKISGNDKRIESMSFTGAQLIGPNKGRPGANYFDVETQMASQLPLSKAARQQFAIDLVNAGILDRVQDRKKIFQILELGSDELIYNDEQLDRQMAGQENILMAQGVQVEINPWDNDVVHMEELRRFQKQPEFKDMLRTQPQALEFFETHFNQHALRYQQMTAPPAPQAAPPAQQGPPPEGAEEGMEAAPPDMGAEAGPPFPDQEMPPAPGGEPLTEEQLAQMLAEQDMQQGQGGF
jgi:hypothetical protein